MQERNRAFIGFDSHTVFANGGSPFTFTTSPHQPYNEGKVFALKISADILFSQIKIPKESMNKIDEKQQQIINAITLKKRIVEKGF